jgi:hypothetical protein
LSSSRTLRICGSLAEDPIVSNESIDHGPRSVFDGRSSPSESHPPGKSSDTFPSFEPSVTIHGCEELFLQNITTIPSNVAAHDRKTSCSLLKDASLNGRLDCCIEILISLFVHLQVTQKLSEMAHGRFPFQWATTIEGAPNTSSGSSRSVSNSAGSPDPTSSTTGVAAVVGADSRISRISVTGSKSNS